MARFDQDCVKLTFNVYAFSCTIKQLQELGPCFHKLIFHIHLSSVPLN